MLRIACRTLVRKPYHKALRPAKPSTLALFRPYSNTFPPHPEEHIEPSPKVLQLCKEIFEMSSAEIEAFLAEIQKITGLTDEQVGNTPEGQAAIKAVIDQQKKEAQSKSPQPEAPSNPPADNTTDQQAQ